MNSVMRMVRSFDGFLAALQQRYNNLLVVIFEDAELRELFTPMLRADFTLVVTDQGAAPTPLPCPLIALGGAGAPGRCLSSCVPGSH